MAAASGRRLGRLLRFLGVRHGQRAEHLLELGHPRIETHHLDALAHRAGRDDYEFLLYIEYSMHTYVDTYPGLRNPR